MRFTKKGGKRTSERVGGRRGEVRRKTERWSSQKKKEEEFFFHTKKATAGEEEVNHHTHHQAPVLLKLRRPALGDQQHVALAVDPMDVDGARTSAWRRRQRRLRSWLKHERQTVAMELAAALHHSRDVGPGLHAGLRAQRAASSREEAGVETHTALRGLKTLPPGMRAGAVA